MSRVLVVIGDRTANEVMDAAQASMGDRYVRIEKLYFELDKFQREDAPRLESEASEVHYLCGIAADDLKFKVVTACDGRGWQAANVIHPTAWISPTASIGLGVFVAPMAVVSSHAKVGDHSIIHIHSSIGHDATVGEFSVVLPGARISGGVRIGDRSLVGSNAFVAPGVRIGDDCRVDAMSYLRQDLPDRYMVSPRHARPVERVVFGGG